MSSFCILACYLTTTAAFLFSPPVVALIYQNEPLLSYSQLPVQRQITNNSYIVQNMPYQEPGSYQGQIQQDNSYPNNYLQPGYTGQSTFTQPGSFAPPAGYVLPPNFVQPGGYSAAPAPNQYGQAGTYPPTGGYLQGGVAVVAAGTRFQAQLKNSIDSASSQLGEEVQATLTSPLYANGTEVIPAGSHLIGQITNVISAKRFQFGANGRVDIRFTQVETPDGRRFPLSASVVSNELRLTGGTTAGRFGKGLATVGVGAAAGALFGTALGPIVGATSHGSAGRGTGMGAIFGTAIGATAGGVGAVARKGSEVKIIAGTMLPVQLDESLQVTVNAAQPMQNPYAPYQGGGYTNPYYPPVQQPAGGFYPH